MSENIEPTTSPEQKKNIFDFSNLAQVIAIATPLLILIGASYKYGIYESSAIDAIWMVSLFSPVDFILASPEIIGYYVIAALYLSRVYDEDNKHLSEFLITCVFIILLGLFFNYTIGAPFKTYIYIFFSFIAFYLILYRRTVGKMMGLLLILFMPFHLGGSQTNEAGL
ncbi:hypothetical protein, partial [Acinetobacter bereziniae]|uniref:hypothetical protein n=1 Tax=Acinetobacter bereziniae TaxID=106648 RepID=UPI003AF87BA9